jgi:aqualysin 1
VLNLILRIRYIKAMRSRLLTQLIVLLLLGAGVVPPAFSDDQSRPISFENLSLCPTSSKAIWGSYQQPYPCIPRGTSLKFQVTASKTPQLYVLNDQPVSLSSVEAGELILSDFKPGLNELAIYGVSGGTRNLLEVHRFIVTSSSEGKHSLNSDTKRYVVSVNSSANTDLVINRSAVDNQSRVVSKSGTALNTVTAELTESDRNRLSRDRDVNRIELDRIITRTTTQTDPQWGLDRIDQRELPLSNSYSYNGDGTGVDVYVIDTGIRSDHQEFTGRIKKTVNFSAISGVEDCDGHGTHVAGTALGTEFGVAKNANLIVVRVFDCSGSTTITSIVRAIDWIISDHRSSTPAVANLSLGGGLSTSLNNAVQELINDGVVTVVAAGNSGANACNYSPSSVTAAIVVGASDQIDQDTSFSNYGPCIDLFAPGDDVISAYIGGDRASAMLSGTSMAAPHVAGVAAILLQENFASISNKATANSVIQNLIIEQSTKGELSSVYGTFTPGSFYFSQNRLLFTQSGEPGPAPDTPPTVSGTPTVTTEFSVGSAATVAGDTWSGSPEPTVSFNWLACTRSDSRSRSGSSIPRECSSLSAPSNREYTVGADAIGKYLRVLITGSNTAGSSSVMSATTRSVIASAPVNTASPSISGTASLNSSLTGNAGSWTSSPSARFSYQWMQCSNSDSVDSCTAISRATSTRFRIATEQGGSYLRFQVTASNSAGTVIAHSAATTQVFAPPAPPSTRSSISIRGSERVGNTLTASTLTWSGSPMPSVTRQWLRCTQRISRQTTSDPGNCVEIAGATNTSYQATTDDVGYYLGVREIATNSSATVTVWSATLRRTIRN